MLVIQVVLTVIFFVGDQICQGRESEIHHAGDFG